LVEFFGLALAGFKNWFLGVLWLVELGDLLYLGALVKVGWLLVVLL
jgi:hypothetical protein